MGLPSPIKSRLRNRFLIDYAKLLRDDLDEFVDGSSTVHRVSVLAGRTSQVIIEVIADASKSKRSLCKSEIVVTNQPQEWLPDVITAITLHPPNRIVVTRPSEYFEQMLHWSNVQEWEDAGYIISHILTSQT